MMPVRNAFACVPVLRSALIHLMFRPRGVPWLLLLPLAAAGCGSERPSWADRNQRVIDEHKITGRTRELPRVSLPMILTDGEPVERTKLPAITIAPGVTATLAVLAGIAASDAACCQVLGQRSRGQDHRQALAMLRQIEPDGQAMARDLERLLTIKDDAHYGMLNISAQRAKAALRQAGHIVEAATGHVR